MGTPAARAVMISISLSPTMMESAGATPNRFTVSREGAALGLGDANGIRPHDGPEKTAEG